VVVEVAVAVRRASRGVIVAGPLSSAAERAAVLHLAARLDWPLIADLQASQFTLYTRTNEHTHTLTHTLAHTHTLFFFFSHISNLA